MRHAAFLLAYDQVPQQTALTIQALETVLAQDIGPLDLLLIDNGSTQQETSVHFQMIRELYFDRKDETHIHIPQRLKQNISPVKVVNRALDYFWKLGHEKVLGVPNDVMLPPSFYRLLNDWPRGLVTASEIKDVQVYADYVRSWDGPCKAVSENTPMATSLIRKWFHDALVARDGMFLDENIVNYASDCDMALRMASCGIHGIQLNIPYWHYGSASHLLDPNGQNQRDQANIDRAYFEKKWGFRVDAYEYGASAADPNFRGIPVSPMAHSATHGSK